MNLFEKLLYKYFRYFDITKDITNANGVVEKVIYLRRFFIVGGPYSKWGRVFLHHIRRQDDDREPHDHPWHFLAIILKGGYTNEGWSMGLREYPPTRGLFKRLLPNKITRVRVGSIKFRKAQHIHRVRDLPEGGAWTLVITGPKVQSWGFFDEYNTKIPWRKYLGIGDEDIYEGD